MADESSGSIHYDWLIRANLERFGPELAAWLFGEKPLEVRTIDSGLAAVRVREADKIFEVQFGSRPTVLLHVEVQTEGRATHPQDGEPRSLPVRAPHAWEPGGASCKIQREDP
jgi:hypothetical protein